MWSPFNNVEASQQFENRPQGPTSSFSPLMLIEHQLRKSSYLLPWFTSTVAEVETAELVALRGTAAAAECRKSLANLFVLSQIIFQLLNIHHKADYLLVLCLFKGSVLFAANEKAFALDSCELQEMQSYLHLRAK